VNGAVVDLHTAAANASLSGLAEPVCYAVRVRAVGASGQRSNWSNRDIATSIVFTNDPLIAGVIPVRSAHMSELRAAVGAVRSAAGLPPFSFTGTIQTGAVIYASHVTELRNALNDALAALGLPAVVFTDLQPRVSLIRAAEPQQLREAMK